MLNKPAKVILVTGFMPFNGEQINPSWQIVKALPETIAGYRIEKLRVPTTFRKSIKTVTKAIDKFQPHIVLCMGQAGGRAHMSVERVAINVDDACIADNVGAQPSDEAIYPDAPAAYFCTLPIKAMAEAILKKNIPAEISNTAGTFVCNHLIYGVLHHIAIHQHQHQYQHQTRAGFMHVPFSDVQLKHHPNAPSLSLASMVNGTKAAIIAAIKNSVVVKNSTAIKNRDDIKSTAIKSKAIKFGGKLH